MLQRLKSFFATVGLDYHNAVVGQLADGERKAMAERDRLRKALAESEATSEQRRVALEHEHSCRKESDENAKRHAERHSHVSSDLARLQVKHSDLEVALAKSDRSLGLSRDRVAELRKSLDNLREATNDAMNFLYRNCNDGSEASSVADNLADAMNN